ncbi:Katanin p60 ATPase-containing subunit A-like 2, partial [Podochytrium sp. JEL0797]
MELSKSHAAEELKTDQRKRNLMVLIMHHLQTHGYSDTVARLQTESNVSLKKVTAADNMDLITILQEYETYFGIKFGKPPKLVKKCGTNDFFFVSNLEEAEPDVTRTTAHHLSSKVNTFIETGEDEPTSSSSSKTKKRSPPQQPKFKDDLPSYDTPDGKVTMAPHLPKLKHGGVVAATDRPKKKKPESTDSQILPQAGSNPSIKPYTEILDNFGIVGTKNIGQKPIAPTDNVVPAAAEPSIHMYENKLLKPLPHYDSFELRELAAIITRDIYVENPNVHWGDIAGLTTSKRL